MPADHCSFSRSTLGTDDVGVHRPEGDASGVGHLAAPALRLAQRVLVADEEGRANVAAEARHFVRQRPDSHDEPHAAGRHRVRELGQPFEHESEVPQAGARETGIEHEQHDDRQAKLVGSADGGIERGIVVGALGALHPVDDGAAVRDGLSGGPHQNPRVVIRQDRARHTATILLAMRTLLAAVLLAAAVAVPCHAADPVNGTVPRFAREPNPIALTGPARPSRYMEASGRGAAFLGREDGSFEAWAYPLKILHDFRLSFGISRLCRPDPRHEPRLDSGHQAGGRHRRYAHASSRWTRRGSCRSTRRAALVLLDVTTSEPFTVYVKFRPDLKPMWPAALGGQYSFWDDTLKAYVIGEGSGKNAALIGSPLGLTPPEQPAHNLPDAPSQFAIRITPEVARAASCRSSSRRASRARRGEEDVRGAARLARGALPRVGRALPARCATR